LVETYGVTFDPTLHAEVLARYEKLHIAPYKGFVNPVYIPVMDTQGNILDIRIDYTESYVTQMMRYSKEHSWLPVVN
jgi:dipeptidyl-peptidase-3